MLILSTDESQPCRESTPRKVQDWGLRGKGWKGADEGTLEGFKQTHSTFLGPHGAPALRSVQSWRANTRVTEPFPEARLVNKEKEKATIVIFRVWHK